MGVSIQGFEACGKMLKLSENSKIEIQMPNLAKNRKWRNPVLYTPLLSVILRLIYRSVHFDALLLAVILVYLPLLRDGSSSRYFIRRLTPSPSGPPPPVPPSSKSTSSRNGAAVSQPPISKLARFIPTIVKENQPSLALAATRQIKV